MLTASRERGVIGGREIDAQHPEDRGQEALGLTQRSVEDETERQGGFDGEIGILELPAPPADASRCPRGDRVRREPESDVASPHEGSVVLGPVPDAIRCRVLRMHSRLHIEIMTRLRSRWSTCRPLLAHRAESAHQCRHPPARPADERLADRDPRLQLAVFAGTVRRVGGPDHEPMRAGRDRPAGQARPRRVRRARRTGRRRWRSGPCHRRCAPPGLPARWRGGTAVGRGHRGACATAATPPVLVPPLSRDRRPGVPGGVSMSVPPPPNGVRGATRAMGRPWRPFARADETRERRPDVGLRASLRQMVMP